MDDIQEHDVDTATSLQALGGAGIFPYSETPTNRI